MLIAKAVLIKYGIYAAIILLGLWLGKQWLNTHDNKVAQQTREEVTEEQRIKAEAKFKAERDILALERRELVIKAMELEKQNDKLHGELYETIRLSKKLQAAGINAAAGVPDSELNAAIRAVLAGRGSQPAADR